MDERHLEAEQTASRALVDQLSAFGRQLAERDADVLDLVRDVVHPLAALREEPAEVRVLPERDEQFDAVAADQHRDRLDTLLLEDCPMLELRVEEPRVRRDGLVEIVHRDADVMDAAGDHAADATHSGAAGRRRWPTPSGTAGARRTRRSRSAARAPAPDRRPRRSPASGRRGRAFRPARAARRARRATSTYPRRRTGGRTAPPA